MKVGGQSIMIWGQRKREKKSDAVPFRGKNLKGHLQKNYTGVAGGKMHFEAFPLSHSQIINGRHLRLS